MAYNGKDNHLNLKEERYVISLNYAQIRKFDIANGIGVRTSLFVSGCTHNCPGCFNELYQAFDYGTPWDEQIESTFMHYVKDKNVHGVTLLGGEPMDQIEDDTLVQLLRRIKEETGKSIWLYSGYTFEQIIKDEKRREILACCDVLVDGRFVEQLKDVRLQFRGSSNQRLIDVPASLEANQVIVWEDPT